MQGESKWKCIALVTGLLWSLAASAWAQVPPASTDEREPSTSAAPAETPAPAPEAPVAPAPEEPVAPAPEAPVAPAPEAPVAPAPSSVPAPPPPSSEAAPTTAPTLTSTPPMPAPPGPSPLETEPVTAPPAEASAQPGWPSAPAAAAGPSAAAPKTAPPPGTTAPATCQESCDLSELEAQLLSAASRDASPDTYGLELYGFADFTYTRLLEDHWREQPWDSFAIGRLNLYAAGELGDGWRSLFEVRFTYLPNGTLGDPNPDGSIQRVDTLVVDYTDLDRYTRWGGIVLERAWLEHTFDPLLTVRVGNWLTPYGIWNVDHGSPVIVGVRRPFIVAEQLLPQYQTGIQAHGFHNLDWVRLGYDLTLSNGRGPIDTYQDLDRNKAFGGRGFVQADTSWGLLTFGTAFYAGSYTDRLDQFVADDNGFFRLEYPITQRFDELNFALDVKWEHRGFLFQAEAVSNDVAYSDDARPMYWELGGPPGFIPDHRRLGAYGLTGYRFDWAGIMPFAGFDYYEPGLGPLGDVAAFWGGVNLRPTARVTLKAQYTYSWLVGRPTPDTLNYNALGFQAAWSF